MISKSCIRAYGCRYTSFVRFRLKNSFRKKYFVARLTQDLKKIIFFCIFYSFLFILYFCHFDILIYYFAQQDIRGLGNPLCPFQRMPANKYLLCLQYIFLYYIDIIFLDILLHVSPSDCVSAIFCITVLHMHQKYFKKYISMKFVANQKK